MKVSGLTVSVDYADHLAANLANWLRGLDSLIVVTTPKDKETIRLCAGIPKIRTFATDVFYAGGAHFNKGAAIAAAADCFGFPSADWNLLLDADITLPENWIEQVESESPASGTLYGARRYRETGEVMPDQTPAGYFLLFHGSDPAAQVKPFTDAQWTHAGIYDSMFLNRWLGKTAWLPLAVKHSGEDGVNWCGRGNVDAMKELRAERVRRHGTYSHEVIDMGRKQLETQSNRGASDGQSTGNRGVSVAEPAESVPETPGLPIPTAIHNDPPLAVTEWPVYRVDIRPDLSILIPSLRMRGALLARLQERLRSQLVQAVEVMVLLNNGEEMIGALRNRLLDAARGRYVVFIDDDDLVAHDYVPKILKAIQSSPDCVCFDVARYMDGRLIGLAKHSLEFTDNSTRQKGSAWTDYDRLPNHLNAIRADLARQARFPNVPVGEDIAYGRRLKLLLKTQVRLEEVLYEYRWGGC